MEVNTKWHSLKCLLKALRIFPQITLLREMGSDNIKFQEGSTSAGVSSVLCLWGFSHCRVYPRRTQPSHPPREQWWWSRNIPAAPSCLCGLTDPSHCEDYCACARFPECGFSRDQQASWFSLVHFPLLLQNAWGYLEIRDLFNSEFWRLEIPKLAGPHLLHLQWRASSYISTWWVVPWEEHSKWERPQGQTGRRGQERAR